MCPPFGDDAPIVGVLQNLKSKVVKQIWLMLGGHLQTLWAFQLPSVASLKPPRQVSSALRGLETLSLLLQGRCYAKCRRCQDAKICILPSPGCLPHTYTGTEVSQRCCMVERSYRSGENPVSSPLGARLPAHSNPQGQDPYFLRLKLLTLHCPCARCYKGTEQTMSPRRTSLRVNYSAPQNFWGLRPVFFLVCLRSLQHWLRLGCHMLL